VRATLGADSADYFDANAASVLRRVDTGGPETRRNVMLVMVESLSAKYMAHFTPGSTLTPRLDDLVGQSVFFESIYATGTRTTRGLEAVTLSIPPTPGHSIVKRIGRETGFWSLGNVLRARGYDVEFIYGGRGYFDNMSAFFEGNGYGVIDESSVPDGAIRFKNAWGMADEDLFRQALAAADAAAAARQPFFFHLMTTSNHRPYTYPDGRVAIPSGTGRDGAVMYTDYAIGAFLDAARERPWFADTLFVIVADHCAGSAGKDALPVPNYHIPMWFYAPAWLAPRRIDALASQMDVAPTILGVLGGRYVSAAFGVDIFAPAHPARALIATYENLGYFDGRFVTVLKPRRRVERYSFDRAMGSQAAEADDLSARARDVALTEAYYEVAAETVDARLNAWSRAVALAAPDPARSDAQARR
jgi:phosphoglycerol transferase MdoB-like AlkP superfamily enzyme